MIPKNKPLYLATIKYFVKVINWSEDMYLGRNYFQ